MAKSLRSKWRRKCRAVKRIRYGQKELERLKKTLGIDNDSKNSDVKMDELNEVATVVDEKHIKEQQTENDDETDEEDMVTDKPEKSLRGENGKYPVWLHPRKRGKKSGKAKVAERNRSTWRIQKKTPKNQKRSKRNKKK